MLDPVNVLLVLNDAPYGTERSHNGLRPALALANAEDFHNIGRMLKGSTTKGVEVGTCGSCMDARGITDADLGEGICRSSRRNSPSGR